MCSLITRLGQTNALLIAYLVNFQTLLYKKRVNLPFSYTVKFSFYGRKSIKIKIDFPQTSLIYRAERKAIYVVSDSEQGWTIKVMPQS